MQDLSPRVGSPVEDTHDQWRSVMSPGGRIMESHAFSLPWEGFRPEPTGCLQILPDPLPSEFFRRTETADEQKQVTQ